MRAAGPIDARAGTACSSTGRHYFTDAGRSAIRSSTTRGVLRVLAGRAGAEPVGVALSAGLTPDGLAVYRLFVRGAELPGRWACRDGHHFTPAQEWHALQDDDQPD